jgi:hypothetical protein
MAVNLAQKYASQLDQLWTHASYTDNWINKKYDFDGVNVVKVYTATSVDPTDYNRSSTGDRFGGNNELQDTIATYTLTKDKAFKIAIDRGNYEQGMRAKKAGEVMRIQMNEKGIPMIDADRLATAAAGATAVSQAVNATTDAYQDTLKLGEFLDEAKAPLEGRVLWVTPSEYNLIKTAITTQVLASGYNDKLVGKGFVGELDGVPVVKVPTSYFKGAVWLKMLAFISAVKPILRLYYSIFVLSHFGIMFCIYIFELFALELVLLKFYERIIIELFFKIF